MEKKSKQSIVIAVSVLLLVTLTLLGLTYAYYRTRIVGNEDTEKSVSVTSKKLEIVYSDDSAVLTATKIVPGDSFTKTFYVENTGDEAINYSIFLDNVTNTFTRKSDWTYTLTKAGVTEPIATGEVPSDTTYIVDTVTIASKVKETYTLTITYADSAENQSDDMGASLSFRVNIDEPNNTWDTAREGTLLYLMKTSNMVVTEDAGLYAAEDDYGTSYYFKGTINNNYVNFAGMCWRIVRVQGDSKIKLVLADRDNLCDGDNYSATNDGAYLANGDTIIGGSFQTSMATTHDITDVLYENSSLETLLNAWLNGGSAQYSATITNCAWGKCFSSSATTGTLTQHINAADQKKMTKVDWCSDTSVSSATYYNASGSQVTSLDPAGYNRNTFSGSVRSTSNLTFKCDMTGIDNTKATIYASNIGLLTYDEAILSKNDSSSYLTDNVNVTNQNIWYHTLTPKSGTLYNYLSDTVTGAFPPSNMMAILPTGSTDSNTNSYAYINQPGYVRPVIALKSTVYATGTGTQGDPYVIG